MAFNISVTAPKATSSIAFNSVNIVAKAILPSAALSFASATSFSLSAKSLLPVAEMAFNLALGIKAVAPLPAASFTFNPATIFSLAAKTKMPSVKMVIGSAWVLKGKVPFPVPVLTFVANSAPFNLNVKAKMPVAVFLLPLPSSDEFSVLVMNLSNKFLSSYENYNFNSACQFNGQYIAAAADGLYRLSGENDNGAQIDASILLGDYDFGVDNIKTFPEFYVNYSGDGEIQVSVKVDQDDDFEGPFQVPQTDGNKIQTRRAKVAKGLRGGRWQYLIENVEGSHVNIQNLELKFQKTGRRLH